MHAEAEAPQMSNEAAAASSLCEPRTAARPLLLRGESDLLILRVEVIGPFPSATVARGLRYKRYLTSLS